MAIERAVFEGAWETFWTIPGGAPTGSVGIYAAFTATQVALGGQVDFDASETSVTGATVVSYNWDFGDATRAVTTTSPTAEHSYVKPGNYTATLTVVDSLGRTASTQRTTPVAVDQSPVASFELAMNQLTVTVDGSDSTDGDGSIIYYDWDFGDGATDRDVTATHTYPFGGEFEITLVVTDNLGVEGRTSQTVVAQKRPFAYFTFYTNGLTVYCDASETTDQTPISRYEWSWGAPGTTDSFGITAKHTYKVAGTYPIALTIKDAAGYETTVTNEVFVTPIFVPEPPTVKITSSTTNLKATFSAAGSSDPDSTITSYAWDFGDGGTGHGVSTTHTYADGGTYLVTCTATDFLGMSGSAHKNVTVSKPVPKPITKEKLVFPYQDMNHRQVILDDDYDPDISWQHHRERGSLGGVDHNCPYGTPLYANSSGRVYTTSLANGGTGGRTLSIHTGSTGWYDQFMHLSSFAVSDGQYVKQGQLVGHSGASGDGVDYYYAPHFHLHRYTSWGERINAWHYFCDDGNTDSRFIKPGKIGITIESGVPNLTFWRRLQWYAKQGTASGHRYMYPCDGYMSIPAWKGVQGELRAHGYTGSIDGRPGKETHKALQRIAHAYGSNSPIDGTLSTSDYRALSAFLNTL